MTRLLLLSIAVLSLSPSLSWSSQHFSGLYDGLFDRYWTRYIPQHDPLQGKAQCYQESLLKPRAVSHAGAMGLCQFMPRTFAECRRAFNLPRTTSPFNAQVSILCNSWYMSRQIRIWKSERPKLERLKLSFASYNAGAGNIIKAQKACNDAPLWRDIWPCLPQITGKNATETITYIERIKRWYGQMRTPKWPTCQPD